MWEWDIETHHETRTIENYAVSAGIRGAMKEKWSPQKMNFVNIKNMGKTKIIKQTRVGRKSEGQSVAHNYPQIHFLRCV